MQRLTPAELNSFAAVTQSSKQFVYAAIAFVLLSWLVIRRLIVSKKTIESQKRVTDPESFGQRPAGNHKSLAKSARPPGAWLPNDFKRPRPKALIDWNVHRTEARPYRPFRWGPYHITMGLRAMQWDEWIELDNNYLKFHADKRRRIEQRGTKCCRTTPEAMDGAIELLEEL